jgi:bisphosphoglycerate-independent phosphoglycerate mutase (AlkP superfamily)
MNKSNSYDIRWLGKISDPKVSAIKRQYSIYKSLKNYPSAQLHNGLNVGLPEGQMGIAK